ncbi:Ecm1p ASCRUDRAFT_69531 [Ascoidea rubescens DSM 1968]|uniref:Uncharacterized protein n=1 Tax=Ascoidea rubescens DSM 1968 TaxID=1344418 RepID=A0A1D2VJK4_9ASCO|nr:hypothetical protein ASCRUDRAFT_69531 [Ascoidea rubescens DSM 1968]ODV61796.1 hypothetical protein ASCRUDRAFT_69531 [Ascoidea rubescens DSM 1968]
MKKKISKHSRAARREVVQTPEEKNLLNEPRKSTIIDKNKLIMRATIKNEKLLQKKLENKKTSNINYMNNKISKNSCSKRTLKNTRFLKEKIIKSLKLDGKLENKVQKSIKRAKVVQNERKSNWDVINQKIKLDSTNADSKDTKTTLETNTETAEMDVELMGSDEESDADAPKPLNPFDMLQEVEA